MKSEDVASGLFLISFFLLCLSFLICRMGTVPSSQIYHAAQANNIRESVNELQREALGLWFSQCLLQCLNHSALHKS